jgi:hypothetical protein
MSEIGVTTTVTTDHEGQIVPSSQTKKQTLTQTTPLPLQTISISIQISNVHSPIAITSSPLPPAHHFPNSDRRKGDTNPAAMKRHTWRAFLQGRGSHAGKRHSTSEVQNNNDNSIITMAWVRRIRYRHTVKRKSTFTVRTWEYIQMLARAQASEAPLPLSRC